MEPGLNNNESILDFLAKLTNIVEQSKEPINTITLDFKNTDIGKGKSGTITCIIHKIGKYHQEQYGISHALSNPIQTRYNNPIGYYQKQMGK